MLQSAQQNKVSIKGTLCSFALILCQTKVRTWENGVQSEEEAHMNAENLTTKISITKSAWNDADIYDCNCPKWLGYDLTLILGEIYPLNMYVHIENACSLITFNALVGTIFTQVLSLGAITLALLL